MYYQLQHEEEYKAWEKEKAEKQKFDYRAFMANRGNNNQSFFGTPHKYAHESIDNNYLNNPDF